MGSFAFLRDLQSSDFRQRHRQLLHVRLIILLLVGLCGWLLHSLGLVANIRLLTGILVSSALLSLYTKLSLEKFGESRPLDTILFLLNIAVDVLLLTLLVVSASQGRTPLVTLYILYVLAIGLFFGFQVSLFPAIFGIVLFIVCSIWLTPNPPTSLVNIYSLVIDTGWLIILLTAVSFISANHARSVWEKERTLTHRERELAAMQNISSATRKMLPLEGVIRLVLTELIYGLRFDFGFLLLRDDEVHTDEKAHRRMAASKSQQEDGGSVRVYHVQTGKNDELIDRVIGFPFTSVQLPAENIKNSFYRAIRQRRTTLHYRLAELVNGLKPEIDPQKAQHFQELSDLKFFVGVPMIAERQVIGALVAATQKDDLPKEQIVSLQKYANQAGLAIESAQRFTEIERKNIALEKANRAKSDFLATMSHELRTPLTAIIGFSELMHQDVIGSATSEQKDAIQEILNNAENLLSLINRILDFEKIEAGKIKLELEDFNLKETVTGIEKATRSLLSKKSLKFSYEIDERLPPLHADERKVRQVLLNLLSNAIKFTPEGGKIFLQAHLMNGHHDGEEEKVEVSIKDSGIGIREKDLPCVFEAFEQVDNTSTREYPGTGLGLALSKRFVEVQGGSIWVESQFGKGSTFIFRLPLMVKAETESQS